MALSEYLQVASVRAYLDTIGLAEGANYNTLVNKGAFNEEIQDLSWHPSQVVNGSSAAGKYQILQRTWTSVARQAGLSDFTPRSQDLAAVYLLSTAKCTKTSGSGANQVCIEKSDTSALQDILSGNLEAATSKANKVWASLPGSPYGQGTKSWSWLTKTYTGLLDYQNGSKVSIDATKTDPVIVPSSSPLVKSTSMLTKTVLISVGLLLIILALGNLGDS